MPALPKAQTTPALYHRAIVSRRQDAAIILPRLNHVLATITAQPSHAVAAKDFGEIKQLLNELRGYPELHPLLTELRELALSIFDRRADELERLVKANPEAQRSPVDTGILKTRSRVLDQMLAEARAADKAAAIEQCHLPESRETTRSGEGGQPPSRAPSPFPSSHSSASPHPSAIPVKPGPSAVESHAPFPKPLTGQAKRRLKQQLHEQRMAARRAQKLAQTKVAA